MDAEYRSILDARNDQLLRKVHWSKELVKAMVTKGLISKDCMKKLELERSESKVFMLLMNLKMCKEPNAFQTFCELLENNDNKEMADSLLFDKDRIQWRFVKDEKASNTAEFLTLLEAELFGPVIEEKDRFRRTAMLKETKRRLKDCIRHLKNLKSIESQARENLLDLYPTEENRKKWEQMITKENEVKSLEEMEREKEICFGMIHCHLSDHIHDLKDQISVLTNENLMLGHRERIKEEQPVEIPTSDLGKKQVELLKKALEDTDKQLLEMKIERRKSLDEKTDSYTISRNGAKKMHGILKTACRDLKEFDENVVDVTEVLLNLVENLVEQMDRMRTRAKQAADHTSQLEKDRAMSLAVLKVGDNSNVRLSESIKLRIEKLETTAQSEKNKNKGYIEEIDLLADENEELREKIRGLEEKIRVWLEASTTPNQKQKPKNNTSRGWRV